MAITRNVKNRLGSVQAEDAREDYTQLASGANLTPGSITSAIAAADRGQIRPLVEMVCDVRGGRDLHLIGVEQTRRSAVSGKARELLPTKRKGVETPAEVVDAVTDALVGCEGYDDLPGVLQDAVAQPLSASELSWDVSEGQAWPVAVDWVHPKRFMWNTAIVDQVVPGDVGGPMLLGELRLLTTEQRSYGVRLKPDKWVIHQLTTQTDYAWRKGLGRALVWYEGFKSFDWKFWSIWLEVCAIPGRVAEVPDTMSKEDRALVESALKSLGSDSYAVISNLAKLSYMAAGNNGDQSYQRMIDAINSEISKAVLGHSGSADTTPGRLGGEGLAGEIRQDLVEADARAIEATIGRSIIAPFVRLNYGPDVAPPRLHLQVDALVSRKELMGLAKDAWSMGLPVDMEALASRCSIPLTKDPAKRLPAPGPQGSAQVVAGVTAPQPAAGGQS